jgi:endonuclease-3
MSDISPAERERARTIVSRLRATYPDARCSLNFANPLELLVATILAAQCTDERVNSVTSQLFQKYRLAEDYANASLSDLEQDLRAINFYRNKSKNVQAMARILVAQYGGQVPSRMDDLLTLPGVARKTSNVVLGNAFGIVQGFIVDTHAGRLARRLGFTKEEDAIKVEQDLMALVDQSDWLHLSNLFIYHGRAVCKAPKPVCPGCVLLDLCPTGKTQVVSEA